MYPQYQVTEIAAVRKMSLADLNLNVASKAVLNLHAVWWVKLLSVNFVVQRVTVMEIPDVLQHLWQKN